MPRAIEIVDGNLAVTGKLANMTANAAHGDDEPFCSNCGYALTGATESSKCPECGRPLVEVLRRPSFELRTRGKRYRSPRLLFGLPLVDIAIGPRGDEARGNARGIIAVGDSAIGLIAIGGVSAGGLAIGGVTFGAVALGGVAGGGIAVGGTTIGLVAFGGAALAIFRAVGGAAFALFH